MRSSIVSEWPVYSASSKRAITNGVVPTFFQPCVLPLLAYLDNQINLVQGAPEGLAVPCEPQIRFQIGHSSNNIEPWFRCRPMVTRRVKKIFKIDYGLLKKSADGFVKKTHVSVRCLASLS